MHTKRRWLIMTCFCCCFMFITNNSHARRRGLMLITSGNDIKHIKDFTKKDVAKMRGNEISEEEMKSASMNGLKVGNLYDHFGFFMSISGLGGKFVLYKDDDGYEDIPQDLAAKAFSKPFSYTVPPLWWIVFAVGIFYVLKFSNTCCSDCSCKILFWYIII